MPHLLEDIHTILGPCNALLPPSGQSETDVSFPLLIRPLPQWAGPCRLPSPLLLAIRGQSILLFIIDKSFRLKCLLGRLLQAFHIATGVTHSLEASIFLLQ